MDGAHLQELAHETVHQVPTLLHSFHVPYCGPCNCKPVQLSRKVQHATKIPAAMVLNQCACDYFRSRLCGKDGCSLFAVSHWDVLSGGQPPMLKVDHKDTGFCQLQHSKALLRQDSRAVHTCFAQGRQQMHVTLSEAGTAVGQAQNCSGCMCTHTCHSDRVHFGPPPP